MPNTKLPSRLLDTSAVPALNVTGDLTVDTTTLKVDSTNNRVGVGIAAPQDFLEVRSTTLGGITISNSNHNQAALSFKRSAAATARIFITEPGAAHTSAMHFQTGIASGPALVTAMTIDETQKVGIGETSPLGKLHVKAQDTGATANSVGNLLVLEGTENGLSILSSTSGAGYILFGDSDDNAHGGILYDQSAGAMRFRTGSTWDQMKILANGDVGIGTAAPNSRLMVIDTGDARKQIEFSNHVTYRGSIGHDAGSGFNEYRTEAGGGKHGFYRGATSTTPEMVIDNAGRVGIGTASPYGRLQIEGASQAWATAPVLVFSSSTTGHATVRDWAIGPADSAYGDFHILQGASTGASPLATANSKMHINAVGNVAIGNAGQAIPAAANLYIKDAADSRVIIYESGASPYTSTLELASQAVGTYGALVQYTSGAEQLTIENYGRALNAGSTSGSIRFRTKVGNGSLTEVMKINGHEGVVTQPHQTFFSTNRAAGNQTFANAAWVDVDWTGEPYDTGANYVLSSGIFTAPVPGTYLFTGLIGFNTITATNYLLARLVCSTAGDFYLTHQQKSTGQVDYGYDQAISKMVYLVANETVKIQVYAASGGNHTLASRSDWQGRLLG